MMPDNPNAYARKGILRVAADWVNLPGRKSQHRAEGVIISVAQQLVSLPWDSMDKSFVQFWTSLKLERIIDDESSFECWQEVCRKAMKVAQENNLDQQTTTAIARILHRPHGRTFPVETEPGVTSAAGQAQENPLEVEQAEQVPAVAKTRANNQESVAGAITATSSWKSWLAEGQSLLRDMANRISDQQKREKELDAQLQARVAEVEDLQEIVKEEQRRADELAARLSEQETQNQRLEFTRQALSNELRDCTARENQQQEKWRAQCVRLEDLLQQSAAEREARQNDIAKLNQQHASDRQTVRRETGKIMLNSLRREIHSLCRANFERIGQMTSDEILRSVLASLEREIQQVPDVVKQECGIE